MIHCLSDMEQQGVSTLTQPLISCFTEERALKVSDSSLKMTSTQPPMSEILCNKHVNQAVRC